MPNVFIVECDDRVNISMTQSYEIPTVQYLLGLDRRGTYVVRESVEKVWRLSIEIFFRF